MSILRSSKFFRNVLTDLRRGGSFGSWCLDESLVLKKCAAISSVRFIQNRPKRDTNTVDEAIARLDRDVRRVGRISGRELLEVFRDIKNTGRATSTQSLFMIRCCGNLVPEETPESRTKLVSEVWDTFVKLGAPLDISHYNALLSVYIENEFVFSPTEFLSKLEAKGIEPNRVTYQRLVASSCAKGDIDEATNILQVMKDKQIPINEAIFNSLITGHAQANDMESAVGVLDLMKQSGLEPSSETYTALLCGYAKQGDIDGLERTLEDAKSKEVVLVDKDILEAVFTLVLNNHLQHIDRVASHLSKSPTTPEDAKNIALRLISRGQAAGAIEVMKIFGPGNKEEGQPLQKGNQLIRQTVRSNWPVDKIVSFCEEMHRSGYNPYGLYVAAETCILNGRLDAASQLLTALAEKETLSQHYFWPILVQYGKNGDFQGVTKTLRQIQDLISQPVSGETLKDYVMPHLRDKSFENLRQAGIPLATSASAMLGYLLSENKIQEAAKLGLKYRANFNNLINRRNLIQAYRQTKDLDSLPTLVQILSESDDEESDVPGQILLGIIRGNGEEAGLILNKYLEVGIGLTPAHAETIKETLGELATPEIVEILSKLSSPEFATATPLRKTPLKRALVEKDESSLLNSIAAVEAKGESAVGLKRQLLMYYCHNKDLEKAVALKNELKDSLEFNSGLLVLFMDLYCHHEKLDEAMEYYKKASAVEGSKLDATKAVRLAALLSKNEKYEDALNVLNAHPQNIEENAESYGHLAACWKFLNALAEKGNVSELKQIFDSLVRNNYVEPTNILLGPLIKVHLLKDDSDAALKEFEECCVKYRATPWKNELTCKFIQREDAVALQKLTDLSTQIHGEVNSLYDLVLAFVECKKVKQARKILETPGLRTKTQRISSACTRYSNAGQIDNMVTLLEVTKGFNHIDRADIFTQLLLAYCKIDDVDRAFALWTQMQEEDVKPSDKFLVNLGQLLERHGREIPFEVPSRSIDSIPPLVKPIISPKMKQFRKALHGRDLDEALQLKNEIKDEDLAKADCSRLVTLLVNNGRIGEASKMLVSWLEEGHRPDVSTLSSVINSIAKIGDIEAIQAIGSKLNQDFKKMVSYSNRFAHCMVEAGRAAELVEKLKSDIENAKTPEQLRDVREAFPRGGIFSVFETAPELIPQVEELEKLYRSKGILDLTNMLWVHYTIKGDVENADKAWELLAPHDRVMFMPILKKARQNFDLSSVESLLSKCRSVGLPSSSLGPIYTSMIDILLSQDKLVESENMLEEALKVCSLDDLGRNMLLKLKKNLELSGKPLQYRIPDKKMRAQEKPREDSSSSSDSDNEENKRGQQLG